VIAIQRAHPKPLCILFSDTKGIQWADTDATEAIEIIRKEGLSIPDLTPIGLFHNALRGLEQPLRFHRNDMSVISIQMEPFNSTTA